MSHHHATCVARQAAGRFRGNVHPVFEDRLTRLIRIGEHKSIDVDHDLIMLARRAGIDSVMERGFCEKSQRIGLLLSHGRRLTGRVGKRRGISGAVLLIQVLTRRGQRLRQERADIRGEASTDDDHAIVIVIHVQSSGGVPSLCLTRLGLPIHASPAAHDALHVRGSPGLCDCKQALFRFWTRHARHGPNFCVRDLSATESLGELRERSERARRSHTLACCAGIEPDAPREPGCARPEPVVPTAPYIELADEIEQLGGGGIEVGRPLRDFVAQAIEFSGLLHHGRGVRRVNFHRSLLVLWPLRGGPVAICCRASRRRPWISGACAST